PEPDRIVGEDHDVYVGAQLAVAEDIAVGVRGSQRDLGALVAARAPDAAQAPILVDVGLEAAPLDFLDDDALGGVERLDRDRALLLRRIHGDRRAALHHCTRPNCASRSSRNSGNSSNADGGQNDSPVTIAWSAFSWRLVMTAIFPPSTKS